VFPELKQDVAERQADGLEKPVDATDDRHALRRRADSYQKLLVKFHWWM